MAHCYTKHVECSDIGCSECNIKTKEIKYCVILPLRVGGVKEILGNRVFHCTVNNNNVEILNDNSERKIHELDLSKVEIVNFSDVYFKEDVTMWLR